MRNMKLRYRLLSGIVWAAAAAAQTGVAPAQNAVAIASANPTSGVAPAAPDDGLFGGLQKKVNTALLKWQQLEQTVDKDVRELASKDPCSPKIPPRIASVQSAMEEYLGLARDYAKVWSEDAHRKNVMMRNLAMSQATAASELSKLKAAEEADLMETQRRFEELQKLGDSVAGVSDEARGLIEKMNGTKAQIDETIKALSDVGNQAEASRILVAIREAKIKEYAQQLTVESVALRTVIIKKTEYYAGRCNAHGTFDPPPPPHVVFGPPDGDRQ